MSEEASNCSGQSTLIIYKRLLALSLDFRIFLRFPSVYMTVVLVGRCQKSAVMENKKGSSDFTVSMVG